MNTLKRPRRMLAASILALAASIGHAEEVFLDRIVAVVDDNVVMQTELDERMTAVIQQLQRDGTSAPPQDQLKSQVLQQLITERLQLNFAENNGIRVSDGQVNQRMRQIAGEQKMSLDQFVEMVHQQGGNLADLRRNLHDQLVFEAIDQLAIRRYIPVSLQEIESFLNSEEAALWKSPELQLGHIQLKLSPGASQLEVQNASIKAKKLLEQLAEGADFRQLAIANSTGPAALQGGDIGWRRTVALPTLLANAVKDLQPGDVSEPVRNDAGLHIFKAYDRRGGQQKMVLQQHNVRHLLLKPNAIRDEEGCYNQLVEIRQRIADGEDFAELAKEFSEGPSGPQGGELGWHTQEEGQLLPEFIQMMVSVETGEVSYPFRSELGIDPQTGKDRGPGWHILEVTERRDKDFIENVTRNKAYELIQNRKFQDEQSIWLQELRSDAYIEIKE